MPLAQLEVAARDVIKKLDAAILAYDLLHPCPYVAAQHHRVSGIAPASIFVRHKGRKWNPGELSLLVSQLVELGNIDLNGSLGALCVFLAEVLAPIKKACLIDEVLHQEIRLPLDVAGDFVDFFQ